jgi:tryptophan 2,3-dioxygenase
MTIDFPEDPIGRELLLMIERAKYERWLSGEIADILSAAFDDVVSTILSPSFRSLSRASRRGNSQLFRELDRQIKSGYVTVRQATLKQMSDYAQLEAQIALKQISTVARRRAHRSTRTAALAETIKAIATLPIQGLSLGEWFTAQAENMSLQTRRVIQNGLSPGRRCPTWCARSFPSRIGCAGGAPPRTQRRHVGDAHDCQRCSELRRGREL